MLHERMHINGSTLITIAPRTETRTVILIIPGFLFSSKTHIAKNQRSAIDTTYDLPEH